MGQRAQTISSSSLGTAHGPQPRARPLSASTNSRMRTLTWARWSVLVKVPRGPRGRPRLASQLAAPGPGVISHRTMPPVWRSVWPGVGRSAEPAGSGLGSRAGESAHGHVRGLGVRHVTSVAPRRERRRNIHAVLQFDSVLAFYALRLSHFDCNELSLCAIWWR